MERMAYLKDVVTLDLNEEKCVGCGMCEMMCPAEPTAIAIDIRALWPGVGGA